MLTPSVPWEFEVTGGTRADRSAYVVQVAGDLDPWHVERFVVAVHDGLRSGLPTEVCFDRVRLFGSAASVALERVLDDARRHGADLRVTGVPRLMRRVLDILGIDDERIEASRPGTTGRSRPTGSPG